MSNCNIAKIVLSSNNIYCEIPEMLISSFIYGYEDYNKFHHMFKFSKTLVILKKESSIFRMKKKSKEVCIVLKEYYGDLLKCNSSHYYISQYLSIDKEPECLTHINLYHPKHNRLPAFSLSLQNNWVEMLLSINSHIDEAIVVNGEKTLPQKIIDCIHIYERL